MIPIQDKSIGYLYSVEIKEGNANSGNWEGPGNPRYAHDDKSDVNYNEKQKLWRDSLSDEEKESIARYTGKKGYKDIRRCMNESVGCNENIKKHITNISTALEKAPDHKGLVYRALSFSSTTGRDEFLARVIRDNELVDKGFVSVAKERDMSMRFAGALKETMIDQHAAIKKSVLIRLESKTGADISKLSKYKGESEVLMKPGLHWELKGISKSYYGPKHKNTYMVVLNMQEL